MWHVAAHVCLSPMGKLRSGERPHLGREGEKANAAAAIGWRVMMTRFDRTLPRLLGKCISLRGLLISPPHSSVSPSALLLFLLLLLDLQSARGFDWRCADGS